MERTSQLVASIMALLGLDCAYLPLDVAIPGDRNFAVTKILGPNGSVVATRAPNQTRTFTTHVADEVNGVLQNVIKEGTGTPAQISRPAAGKTGTTEQHRDVWFAGYTPDPGLAAAVWIGYPPDKNGNIKAMTDLHGVQATGGGFAVRIWKYFMEAASAGMPKGATPRHTTLDSETLRDRYGVAVPDVWAVVDVAVGSCRPARQLDSYGRPE